MDGKQRSILSKWNEVKKKLHQFHHFVVLFDYDGTLSAISRLPSEAKLSNSTKKSLMNLSHLSNCTVGIVSGRALPELRRLVKVPGLVYVGNHGLEIESDGWSFTHPAAKLKKPLLQKIGRDLSRTLNRFPGAFVENKGSSLSIHYRQVKPRQRAILIDLLKERLSKIIVRNRLLARQGRKVLEILPTSHWHKGSAVAWLKNLAPSKSIVFYIGDDTTDEDAFRVLKYKGLTIRVGTKGSSSASYYLRRQSEVGPFIRKLVDYFSTQGNPNGQIAG